MAAGMGCAHHGKKWLHSVYLKKTVVKGGGQPLLSQ